MTPSPELGPPDRGELEPAPDAARRTHLANERTYLAWWRTGLTALASGVAIGRLVPSLTHQTRWPYAILGAGFAALGIVVIGYGFVRQREVRDAVCRGSFEHPHDTMLIALTGISVALGTLLLVLVVVQI